MQVVTNMGSADDIKGFSVSGVMPTGTVIVNSGRNIDVLTKSWNHPTEYNNPVFRRGIDNPIFILELDSPLPENYEALFEIYSPSSTNPICSGKSAFSYDALSLASIWFWTDSNGVQLDKNLIPIGIYTVKGYLTNVNDPSDKIYIGSSDFYVVFDFDEDIQSFVTWDKENGYALGTKGSTTLIYPRPHYKLNLWKSEIWKRAIKWADGAITTKEAVDKISELARSIDGEMVYHHSADKESGVFLSDFRHDEYDNDFDEIIDEADEAWEHNYKPYNAAIVVPDYGYNYDIPSNLGKAYYTLWSWNIPPWELIWVDGKGNEYPDSEYSKGYEKADRISWYFDTMKMLEEHFDPENKIPNPHQHSLGVCEDYAMLTVGYLRAIGIPSRIVCGINTELHDTEPHAWVQWVDATGDGQWCHLETDYIAKKTTWESNKFNPKYYDETWDHVFVRNSENIDDVSDIANQYNDCKITSYSTQALRLSRDEPICSYEIIGVPLFKPGENSTVALNITNPTDENKNVTVVVEIISSQIQPSGSPIAVAGDYKQLAIPANSKMSEYFELAVPGYAFPSDEYNLDVYEVLNDNGTLVLTRLSNNSKLAEKERRIVLKIKKEGNFLATKSIERQPLTQATQILAKHTVTIGIPDIIIFNESFSFNVTIGNIDAALIHNVSAELDTHYDFNTTESLRKEIPVLDVGENHTFTWRLTPIWHGDLRINVAASTLDAGGVTKMVRVPVLQTPELYITPIVPEKVEKGDDFLLNATVYNSGDIPSDTVTVNITLPENVTANRTSVVIGTISAHENKTCIFRISQNKSEDFVIFLNATATNVTATNYAFINIIQPNMWIDILYEDETLGIEQHIGVIETLADEPCNLTVYIRNTGDENLSNVQVLTNVGINKDVGEIKEGESKHVSIKFTPTIPGLVAFNATVKSDEIEKNTSRALLVQKFDFTVSIPKTQYDQNEPVPINISITNEVPNMRFIDAKIEIDISNSNFNQTFKIPLLSLGPMVTKNTTFTWDTTGVNNGAYTIVTSLVIAEQEVLSDEKNVYIGTEPPIADANGPYRGVIEYIAVPITFDGTGSYDPDGTIIKYAWDLDNDSEFDDAVGATPTVSFTAPCLGIIHLKVTDNNGATDTDSTTLTITKQSPPPNGIHGGLLTPPEQPQCYSGTSKIQGKGNFTIDERIQDWATAIDTTEHMEGTGEFEMDSKTVLNQAANTSDFYDPNFYHKKTMQFQGNATNRLINRETFESSGIFGGTGTRINEYFDVSMIQKDESSSIKTISAPGSGQSHKFATMDDFSGIWGIRSEWQKICQKDIRHHQMFMGNFSVQKDLTFEREVVAP
ncbi:MAG: transglutaminase domain-containing protein [Halobacteriota archaeon]